MAKHINRRQFIISAGAMLGTSLLLKACDGNSPSPSNSNDGYKVAIALPGLITDKSWNQSGYEGIQLVKQKLGVETAHIEKVSQADQTEVLSDFARRNYNLVFAHGGQFDAAIQQIAPQFPNTFFVGVNGAISGANFGGLRIDHLQASYLCGIIAALMTKSNKLAYIAGQKFAATEEELRGLELGAKSVKPEIQIASTFTGDWNDVAKAKEATLAFISTGADVVYQWLDSASFAVLQTASERGIYAFGNTTDQLDVAPKAVLTSAVKRLDLAIAYLAGLGKQNQLKGQVYKIGLDRQDILSLGKFSNLVKLNSSSHAIKLGIGMIHQHFMLISQLTVTENIILGLKSKWHLNLPEKQREITALSQSYNLDINPNAKVGDLPIGSQQKVEILKVLYRQAQLLILDEPTAVLAPSEVNSLIVILRQLADNGKTIIFISHKLEEVISLCDTVTVLRKGKVVANATIDTATPQQLAKLMVGREVALSLDKPQVSPEKIVLSGENIQVEDDRGVTAVSDVSFEIRAGEILGVAGVDGNGQRELADAICGLRRIEQGKLQLHQTPSLLAYIPEDRQKMGLVLEFSIAHNLILKTFRKIPFCRRFILQPETIKNQAMSAFDEYDIRAKSSEVKVKQLSGGNQQKIVLARELAQEPTLIVAMQPTRGLDIGATQAVQEKLLAQKKRGAAILYISTELEEIIAMSDKIAVMYGGRFVKLLDAGTATVEEIGFLMAGGRR